LNRLETTSEIPDRTGTAITPTGSRLSHVSYITGAAMSVSRGVFTSEILKCYMGFLEFL